MDKKCSNCNNYSSVLKVCKLEGMLCYFGKNDCTQWASKTGGSSPKIKGDDFERLVVEILKKYPAAFKDTRRQYASGATEPAIFKNDVFTKLGLKFLEYKMFIECKHHQQIGIYKFYDDARDKISKTIGYIPALAVKQDYTREQDILICLPLVTFCEIVNRLVEYAESMAEGTVDTSDKPEVIRACRSIEDSLNIISKQVSIIKREG